MSLKGIGAGRDKIKPHGYGHITPPDVIYHVDCGGKVERTIDFSDWFWQCESCKQKWKDDLLKRWPLVELQARFYMEPTPDSDEYVIVEDSDGHKSKFTRTMRRSEARSLGLKKLPDLTKCQPES